IESIVSEHLHPVLQPLFIERRGIAGVELLDLMMQQQRYQACIGIGCLHRFTNPSRRASAGTCRESPPRKSAYRWYLSPWSDPVRRDAAHLARAACRPART